MEDLLCAHCDMPFCPECGEGIISKDDLDSAYAKGYQKATENKQALVAQECRNTANKQRVSDAKAATVGLLKFSQDPAKMHAWILDNDLVTDEAK